MERLGRINVLGMTKCNCVTTYAIARVRHLHKSKPLEFVKGRSGPYPISSQKFVGIRFMEASSAQIGSRLFL